MRGETTARADAPGIRWFARLGAIVGVVAALVASSAPHATAASQLTPAEPLPECAVGSDAPHVSLFGDSLGHEAKSRFIWELQCSAGVRVDAKTQPGAALCDFRGVFREALARGDLDVVVLEFVGNNRTDCVRGPTGQPLNGPALLERYRADAIVATSGFVAAGARVVWVTPPGFVDHTDLAMRRVYESVAEQFEHRVSVVDGGKDLRDAIGYYRAIMPCMPPERSLASCKSGVIRVRMPVDNFHLCPVLKPGPCPYYSSGATRFARAMATGATAALSTIKFRPPDDTRGYASARSRRNSG